MLKAAVIALPLLWREPQPAGPYQPVRTGIQPGFWVRLIARMGDV